MKKIITSLCLLALCLLPMGSAAGAAEAQVLSHSEYCFTQTDFSVSTEQTVSGIFVTQVPDASLAVVKLGNRSIRPGDVLCSEDLPRLRLQPAGSKTGEAVLCYCPIYGTVLGEPDELRIRVCSGKNQSPKAENAQLETYKNVANEGQLRGSDPENAALIFRLEETPKRGSVVLEADGRYVYTPEKNKVGEDSFTFTVTDEAGNVSAPATVKITILKPSDAMSFADLQGSTDVFEAMWMQQQGLTRGEQIGSVCRFGAEQTVSRTEFLLMVMELWDIAPEQEAAVSCFSDHREPWLQPWLTAALRCGLIRGEAGESGLIFRGNDPITAAEAAVMLQNALQLPVPAATEGSDITATGAMDGFSAEAAPAWACASLSALADAGMNLPDPTVPLTRLQAAKLLYQAEKLSNRST